MRGKLHLTAIPSSRSAAASHIPGWNFLRQSIPSCAPQPFIQFYMCPLSPLTSSSSPHLSQHPCLGLTLHFCPQQADESLNFEEQILEAAKSIAAATSALVKAASAAQRELVAQGKVRLEEEKK